MTTAAETFPLPNSSDASNPASGSSGIPGPSSEGRTASSLGSAASAGPELLSRVVRGAHETIDSLAETAAPHVTRLSEGMASAGESLQARAEQVRDVGDEWAESLRETVREHPLVAVGAAVALGMLIARLSR